MIPTYQGNNQAT